MQDLDQWGRHGEKGRGFLGKEEGDQRGFPNPKLVVMRDEGV